MQRSSYRHSELGVVKVKNKQTMNVHCFIFLVLKNGKEENLIPFFFFNPFHCNRSMLGMTKMQGGNSLVVQWLRFLHSQCRWCWFDPRLGN